MPALPASATSGPTERRTDRSHHGRAQRGRTSIGSGAYRDRTGDLRLAKPDPCCPELRELRRRYVCSLRSCQVPQSELTAIDAADCSDLTCRVVSRMSAAAVLTRHGSSMTYVRQSPLRTVCPTVSHWVASRRRLDKLGVTGSEPTTCSSPCIKGRDVIISRHGPTSPTSRGSRPPPAQDAQTRFSAPTLRGHRLARPPFAALRPLHTMPSS
jgi:hypothetical protein